MAAARSAADLKKLSKALKAFALGLPETREDHPWGETVAKVGKKVFVFNLDLKTAAGYPPGISVKLRPSLPSISTKSYASPTGYGLGKSGWISIRLDLKDAPTKDELIGWIRESYCNVAPKKLVKLVDPSAAPPEKKPSRKE